MNQNDYLIRLERISEQREVENLVREAFWNVYQPGCFEHYVLHQLRHDTNFVSSLNFVMEQQGEIIVQIVFVNAKIRADDGREVPVMTMGPISIAPQCQHQGYGTLLLNYALKKAEKEGAGAICFEGNIHFYGKSGFAYASKKGIRYHGLPENADASFFLCKELKDGCLDGIAGEYTPSSVYFVDEAAVEVFDREFPLKTKLNLPTQIFS